MPTSRMVGLAAAIVFGVPALLLLLDLRFPGIGMSLRFLPGGRDRERRRRADIAEAAAYHEHLPSDARADALDNRTWQDLDLDDVFLSIDHTASAPGRQYLYHLLRTPRSDGAWLERLERTVREIAASGEVAGRICSALRTLDNQRAGRLAHLFLGELPARPRAWWIFPLLTAAALACLALVAFWPRALIVWLGISVASIGVQLLYKPRVKRFVPAIHELPGFLDAAKALGSLELPGADPEIHRLRKGATRLDVLRRATAWLKFEPGMANDVAASIYEYVNLFFLLDVNAFVFTIESLRAEQEHLREMFEAIGYLDTAQSIAAWRRSLPSWSNPQFTAARKAIVFENLVHPLVFQAVPNSLRVDDVGVLITGSNMSGKTTFIRALGVSAILAQTVHTTCAAVWRAPVLRVRTSIGRADSVLDGKSYYLAEAESVRALVRATGGGQQHLFLLDEIFRGTNTTERVAAASAVLSYLNRGNDLVFVATHDIEVLELLGDGFDAYHFREQVDDDVLTFDYRIHSGPSSTRNAITLLRLMEYPEELVAEALAAVDWASR